MADEGMAGVYHDRRKESREGGDHAGLSVGKLAQGNGKIETNRVHQRNLAKARNRAF
jgi:hypothetical protein